MKKSFWFLKDFIASAVVSSTLIFICLQIYFYIYPEKTLSAGTVWGIGILSFSVSLAVALYFGFQNESLIKRNNRILVKFISSLRRGKYAERLQLDGKDVDNVLLIEELNALASQMEEQAMALQRISTEKSELTQQISATAVVEERQRLARELHDSVSQQLFALNMMSSAAVKIFDVNPDEAKRQLEQIASIATHAQGEMRALLLHLRPIELREESLSEGVLSFLKELQSKTNLQFNASVDEIEGLPRAIEVHLFRIIQEALSNSLRHANADQIKLILTENNQTVYLYIGDNGKGFDTSVQKKVSYGLKTMKERCDEIGGTFTLRSQKGKGTYIEVRVPFIRNR